MADMDDDELLAALGVEVTPLKTSSHTPKEERIIAGFEDVVRFVETHGRSPQHGDGRDIFEHLYAVRLDRLRHLPEALTLLAPLDRLGLLSGAAVSNVSADELDEDALLAELGASVDVEGGGDDITVLRHVRTYVQRKALEDIADRKACQDFAEFQPLFEKVERQLKDGSCRSLRFGRDASIAQGDFFILGGQLAYVADMAEQYRTPNGEANARMRVIFSNGTESDLLLRSLQRALYKDDTGRRLVFTDDPGPLFGGELEADDIETGTIYVLRSLSEHPFVAEYRDVLHKIGVTGGKVEGRIANAEKDATYLLARVEVVATYKLHNINRTKLENIFHRLFGSAQLELTIEDRFGHPVRPREWFLVPLPVIDEAVQRIVDGTITGMVYDRQAAKLVVDSVSD